jgi:DNA-binding MarR family transcriptional regulator
MLDRDVESVYSEAGLDYRPRYTPVVRHVAEHGPSSIRAIADRASLTHSAASQTVAEMVRRGLATTIPGADARERIVALTPAARAMLPELELYWAATASAAASLFAEIGIDLEAGLAAAIEALGRRSFFDRITAAGATSETGDKIREPVQ